MAEVPHTAGTQGLLPGVHGWALPTTPNGLVPNQSWFSIAPAPDGSIYVSGSDHTTNTALYRLAAGSSDLRYVGDARSASEAADNWLPAETAEKFHVRPLWYRDRVYVATADYSDLDDGYLQRRGFHWYAYDEQSRALLDLSASEPSGVAAEHVSIMASALDEARGFLYGLGSPTGHLYQYDIAAGTTRDLGRHPLLTLPYYAPGRFIWVDSRGRVYFTVGNARALLPGEPPAPRYVLTWDLAQGFGDNPSFRIGEPLRTGQCSFDKRYCLITDGRLNLFLFDDQQSLFFFVGAASLPSEYHSSRTGYTRVRSMQVSANLLKIYFANDTAPVVSLFEWDWSATNVPRELARLPALHAGLTDAHNATTGHDSWDPSGKFYFTAFGGEGAPPTPDVLLVGIDPVRLKASQGMLPGVSVLSIQTERGIGLLRRGDTSTALEVLVESTEPPLRASFTLPAGAAELDLPAGFDWRVVPDGDTYVAGRTCEPSDRRYCNWMGSCNERGSACQCDDAEHRSPEDQCSRWRLAIVPPGMSCKPGDRSYCHWMGSCDPTGSTCECDDPQHWLAEERCQTFHLD